MPLNALEVKDTQGKQPDFAFDLSQRNNWSLALPGIRCFSGMNKPGPACIWECSYAATEIIKGPSVQLAAVPGACSAPSACLMWGNPGILAFICAGQGLDSHN